MPIDPITQEFVLQHRCDDVRQLALQAKRYPQVDMPLAIRQIAGWQTLRHKVPTWAACDGLIYPTHLPLEQCSSEATARYKQLLAPDHKDTFTDLTGGLGIDCYFLSRCFKNATYVERQAELVEAARHNMPLLGSDNISIVQADCVEYLRTMLPVDCVFMDPARRDTHGGKTVALADCVPDITEMEEILLQKARRVIVKLSPMLDLSLALSQLHHVLEAHIVSVAGECKELLLVLEPQTTSANDIPIHCINLKADETQAFVFSRLQESQTPATAATEPLQYLYEPNASILKAGAFKSLAAAFEVQMIHPNSHLYTSEQPIPSFPGRRFRIDRIVGFGKAELKAFKGMQANLSIRNFPASVAELRKRLQLKDGGDLYLIATTAGPDSHKVLIACRAMTEENIAERSDMS